MVRGQLWATATVEHGRDARHRRGRGVVIYIALVVGCIECGRDSHMAAFRDRADAESWLEQARQRYGAEGFYTYEIHEVTVA